MAKMSLGTMILKMSEGLGTTCGIFFLTLLFSLPLGLVVTLLRRSRLGVVRGITKVYISIMRGTPLMLQLMVVYYGPFYLSKWISKTFDVTFRLRWSGDVLVPIIIGFVLNYAAYFAEIYRSGIESIPVGQYEAAQVLGYSRPQTFLRIVLPQVVKRVLPSVTNEVPGKGHLPGLYPGLHGDVHPGQVHCQFPIEIYALRHCRRVLLCV